MLMMVARRLGLAIPTLIGVSLIVFLLLTILPGDPLAGLLDETATQESRDALAEEMGLNDPLPVRYANWSADAIRGDLGYSQLRRRDVTELIGRAWQNTAILAAASAVFGLTVGVAMGSVAGVYRGKWPDRVVSSFAITGLSVPSFWVAIVLLIIFSAEFQLLPASGMARISEGPVEFLKHLAMPLLAGSLVTIAITARITRASVIETFSADFVDTLRAKGLKSWQILLHVGKNASSPVLTTSGLQIGNLLGGSVLIETIFSWPGMGQLVFIAISQRDLQVVQGTILVIAVTFVLLNILVDLLQTVIDPRLRAGF